MNTKAMLFSWRNIKCASAFRQCVHFSTSKSSCKPTIDLSGIFPPIATPFNVNESIAYDKLQKNFEKWNKIPFRGYVVEGSTGEYVFLSSEERIELVKKAKSFSSPQSLIVVGSGCESTKETIKMTTQMSEAGADAALIVTPSYYKSGMKDHALFHHYEEIANNIPIPVILYSVPANTGYELSADVIVDLSHHENIVGMKDSGGDISRIGSILHRTQRENFQVLAGSAGFLLAALHLGCVGGICAVANVLGQEVCQLYQHFQTGHKEAFSLQKQLIAPNAAVTKMFGIPGLKEVMDAKGYFGGITRSPLQKLSSAESKKLKAIFNDGGYF